MDYLGCRIDVTGLHPLLDKVNSIQDAPMSKLITELKSKSYFSYYCKFLPNLLFTLYRSISCCRKTNCRNGKHNRIKLSISLNNY